VFAKQALELRVFRFETGIFLLQPPQAFCIEYGATSSSFASPRFVNVRGRFTHRERQYSFAAKCFFQFSKCHLDARVLVEGRFCKATLSGDFLS